MKTILHYSIVVLCALAPFSAHGQADSARKLWDVIDSKKASDSELKSALSQLDEDLTSEQFTALARIANDVTFANKHRVRCFLTYWRVRCADATPFKVAAESAEVKAWFTEAAIHDASMFKAIPVRRAPGLGVIILQPPFVEKEQAACFMLFNKDIPVAELAKVSKGTEMPLDLWLVQVEGMMDEK